MREEAKRKYYQKNEDIPPYEADEFIIGDEGGPLTYSHVKSTVKESKDMNENIWTDMTLNPKIRLQLLDIVDYFWDDMGLSWVKPSDYLLVGSICNYTWDKNSPIEVCIIVDFSKVGERKDFVKEYFSTKEEEWRDNHGKLRILGSPIIIRMCDENEKLTFNGVYSLEKNKWVEEPTYDEKDNIKKEAKSKSLKLISKIDNLCDKFKKIDDKHKVEELQKDANAIVKELSRLKINTDLSVDRYIYEILTATKYIDKIIGLYMDMFDRLHSLKKTVNEEVVADGNSDHNMYEKRWKKEREDLKNFISTYGKLMTSLENGKKYVVYFTPELSRLIGNNYGICLQWDDLKMQPKTIVYIRAMDKFTDYNVNYTYDRRGVDNSNVNYNIVSPNNQTNYSQMTE